MVAAVAARALAVMRAAEEGVEPSVVAAASLQHKTQDSTIFHYDFESDELEFL